MKLPIDLVLEIQLYLPVKSLLRFRCICKSWCSRFQNPNFIKDHHLKQLTLDGNNFSNSSLMIEQVGINHGRNDGLLCFTSFSTNSNNDITLNENIYMPFPQEDFINREVLGPVNGVFCVTGDALTALWNPATREIKVLPVSTLERPTRFPPLAKHEIYDGFGFGFDYKSSDYKVVAFVGFSYFESPQTEVYTLSTNSWKVIPSHGYNLNYFRQYKAYVNGVFHWFATDTIPNTDPIQYIQQIVSFDMVDEEFSTTPLPDVGATWWENGWFVAAIDDCPAAIVCRCEAKGGPKWYDVWVLKELGFKESWFKKHTMGPISGIYRPIGLWKYDRVFVDGKTLRVMMYDLDSEKLVDLHVRIPFSPVSLVIYVESLVSINGREKATHLKVQH